MHIPSKCLDLIRTGRYTVRVDGQRERERERKTERGVEATPKKKKVNKPEGRRAIVWLGGRIEDIKALAHTL